MDLRICEGRSRKRGQISQTARSLKAAKSLKVNVISHSTRTFPVGSGNKFEICPRLTALFMVNVSGVPWFFAGDKVFVAMERARSGQQAFDLCGKRGRYQEILRSRTDSEISSRGYQARFPAGRHLAIIGKGKVDRGDDDWQGSRSSGS